MGNALGATNIASARNITGSGINPMPGFTVSAGAFGGAGLVYTFSTEIALGTYTDMSFGLYAAAYPSWFGGSANNDFFSTAKLTAINVLDSAGNVLPDSVSGIGTSGFTYDGTGAHALAGAVPEPASWALMIGGLGLVGGALRRRTLQRFAC